MPDNNFEEDVRKKMEELRFVPSGDVWTKVEENIREDRKRRRFLFWLPLTGLLIGGLLWFAWPAKNGTPEAKLKTGTVATTAADTKNPGSAISPDPAMPATGAAETAASTNRIKSSDSQPGNPAPDAGTENAGSDPTTSSTGISAAKKAKSSHAPAIDGTTGKPASAVITNEADYLASMSQATAGRKNNAAPVKKYRAPGKFKSVKQSDKVDNEENGNALIKTAETKNASDGNVAAAVTNDNTGAGISKTSPADTVALAKKDVVKIAAKIPASNEVAASNGNGKKTVKPDSKKHKIEWGITAFGGVSKQIEKNVIPSDVLNRAYSNSTLYILKKSELRTGPAFSAGFVASKQIGKKWRLQTGIQYAYYSSKVTNAGQSLPFFPVNNSPAALSAGVGVNAFAPSSSKSNSYSNRFQFIQIPITVEKQLGANSPLSAQAGIALGYLSGIHALIYQPLLDQYWQDNAEFNKFQMTGLAGVYWKFKLDNSWSLRAGPELQYQFTNLMKSSVSVNDHLLSGGIRVTLIHSAK